MSYTFSRRDFLKYSAMTAVAVAGAGLLTGCEIQDPNNPVIKKLGYGTTLGTTGGLLKSVDTEGTDGVFTFTVKNNSDAPLRMTTPIELFTVEVLDAKGNRKWNNNFNLTIEAVPGEDGKVPEIPPVRLEEPPWHVPRETCSVRVVACDLSLAAVAQTYPASASPSGQQSARS